MQLRAVNGHPGVHMPNKLCNVTLQYSACPDAMKRFNAILAPLLDIPSNGKVKILWFKSQMHTVWREHNCVRHKPDNGSSTDASWFCTEVKGECFAVCALHDSLGAW